MAYTTIDKPTDYFNTVLYTGDGSSPRNITGVGFDPDWVWIKNRSIDASHFLGDRLRGDNKNLNSNASAAEEDNNTKFRSLVTDGFQVGSHAGGNGSGNNIVAWNWLAGGSAASNSDGSITSSVSANTTAGFSIVSWTGTGANATVGHGLGAVPQMFIIKNRSASGEWAVYHEGLTNAAQVSLFLDLTSAVSGTSALRYNNTAPTSSVFSLGSSSLYNGSSNNMIAYCFTDIKGYSKVGSYVGTGSDVFIHTGFNVGWLLIKNASDTNGWLIIDTKRSPANPQGKYIYANASSAEGTVTYGEFFSNGFGWKGTSSVAVNQSGNTFIYLAIAESPFVNSNGVPTNAR